MSKILNDPTIINHTYIKVCDGLRPHRLVLRHLPDEVKPYVTHMENMKLVGDDTYGHEDFYWGNYFDSLEDANKDFEKRSDGSW